MVEAVIWDMDGVLIDSEPLWHEAEMAIFRTVGFAMTREHCLETQGMRVDKVVEYWHARYPWTSPPSLKDVEGALVQAVIDNIQARGEALSGVRDTLAFLAGQGVRMAIASSSPMIMIEAVVSMLAIGGYFEMLYSAEYEPYGKPHPGVYLSTAAKLDVSPSECLVIEDSMRGILAAKAAEMRCLAVPDPALRDDPRLAIADWVLPSLALFDSAFWERIQP
ncbi:MAG: hexitol phosphatase HxpB [Chloroflexi bacterium]|nr:hexitol phosphatase HxpB [Chloroflexota bacterium]